MLWTVGSSYGSIATVIRIFRIGRVLRLVRGLESMAQLFNTLLLTLPSLGNVGALLCLLFFIYAAMGVQLFAKVTRCQKLSRKAARAGLLWAKTWLGFCALPLSQWPSHYGDSSGNRRLNNYVMVNHRPLVPLPPPLSSSAIVDRGYPRPRPCTVSESSTASANVKRGMHRPPPHPAHPPHPLNKTNVHRAIGDLCSKQISRCSRPRAAWCGAAWDPPDAAPQIKATNTPKRLPTVMRFLLLWYVDCI